MTQSIVAPTGTAMFTVTGFVDEAPAPGKLRSRVVFSAETPDEAEVPSIASRARAAAAGCYVNVSRTWRQHAPGGIA